MGALRASDWPATCAASAANVTSGFSVLQDQGPGPGPGPEVTPCELELSGPHQNVSDSLCQELEMSALRIYVSIKLKLDRRIGGRGWGLTWIHLNSLELTRTH
jgi:hypothetical protein